MRIGIASQYFPPAMEEGIARARFLLAREYCKLGHEVHVFTRADRVESFEREGLCYHTIPTDLPKRFFFSDQNYANRMLTYSQSLCELVQSVDSLSGLDVLDVPLWELEGMISSMYSPCPVIVRMDTTIAKTYEINRIPLDHQRRFEIQLENIFLKNSPVIAADSKSIIEEMDRLHGIHAADKDIRILSYGIPVEEAFPPHAGKKAESDTVEFLTVGRLERRKGTDLLFQIIDQVTKQHPKSRFHIVGRDNSENDGFRNETGMDYRSFFYKKFPELKENVVFHGYVDRSELDGIYRNSDIAIIPSIYESFGLVYLEAMVRGIPTVAFNCGGASEIISSGEDGITVPVGDAVSMAASAISLASDTLLRKSIGKTAISKVKDKYGIHDAAFNSIKCYESLKV